MTFMYNVEYTNRFKKDMKRCQKRGKDMSLIFDAIKILAENGTLPQRYSPHKLSGRYDGKWECHIEADWLLVWEQYENQLRLIMTNTGTHSDIF